MQSQYQGRQKQASGLRVTANPNDTGGNHPVLVESVELGNIEIIRALVENGAAVDATEPVNGFTALHNASHKGRRAIAAYLIDRGANVHHRDKNGWTPIALAANVGCTEIVELLIRSGAGFDTRGPGGWEPIHLCAKFLDTTKLLLKHGAKVDSLLDDGTTPLIIAASSSASHKVAEELLSYNSDLEIMTAVDHDTALTAATMSSNISVIRMLLEAGANIDHQSRKTSTPLHHAVKKRLENVVRLLLKYNPNLNAIDEAGNTALHLLDSLTSVEIVKCLVNRGIDLEIPNLNRSTALTIAVDCRNYAVVTYLARKAKINIAGGAEGGPLHVACFLHDIRLVKILIDAGADVNATSALVGSPLQCACTSLRDTDWEKQKTVVDFLINEAHAKLYTNGGHFGCAVNAACAFSDSTIIRRLVSRDARIDCRDNMGRAAIHFAAARSLENLQTALHSRADINARDMMGRAVLHWACIGGIADVVDRVIDLSGGSVDPIDRDGWTPLLWAARSCETVQTMRSSREREEVIELLLNRGADPCVLGNGSERGWSPAKVAQYHGVSAEVVQLLRKSAEKKIADTGDKLATKEEPDSSQKATKTRIYCSSCLSMIYGIHHCCKTCLDFGLCYKCLLSSDVIHPMHHQFHPIQPENPSDTSDEDESEDDIEDTSDYT